MRLIEDILNADDRSALDNLLNSNEARFDLLVHASGLNPVSDFRFANLRWVDFSRADLRGYDFTGADLRYSSKDPHTIIDKTTIFDGTAIEWIEREAIPIVQQMIAAQNAGSADVRRSVLSDLVANYGRSEHVVQYLMSAVLSAKSFEELIDFASFLPRNLPRTQIDRFKSAAMQTLEKKVKRSQSRTRRSTTANLAASSLIDLLQKAEDSVATQVFENLAARVNEGNGSYALKGHAMPTMADIKAAISRL